MQKNKNIETKIRYWFLIVLGNFVVATILGSFLRFIQFSPIRGFNFQYLMHAHSHVAMLGWLYMAFFIYFTRIVVKAMPIRYKTYRVLFRMTQMSVAGMLVSFAYQGYGAVSISFSALHIVLSYIFALNIFRDIKKTTMIHGLYARYLKTALWWMILSTVGVLGLGPVIAITGKHSTLYELSIQFYLHFQINGWVVFAVMTCLIARLDIIKNSMLHALLTRFYYLLTGATLLTFALPVAWYAEIDILYYLNSAGVVIQLLAGLIFIRHILPGLRSHNKEKWYKNLIVVSAVYFILKFLFQVVLVDPGLAEAAMSNRILVIAFLHLILLGFASHFLLSETVSGSLSGRFGRIIFITGVMSSELLQLMQGALFWMGKGFIPGYFALLFSLSLLIPVGSVLLFVSYFRQLADPVNTR